MSPWTTRNDPTPLPSAPRTSDSMARMFRSRVEQTTVGRTPGTSCVIRAAKAYGERRTCLKGLSVMRTRSQRPSSWRWDVPGNLGGLTSTISTHEPGAESTRLTLADCDGFPRFPQTARGRDHVPELAVDLLPAARLEAAVGIDPQVTVVHESAEMLESFLHHLDTGGMGGVNVEDTGTDLQVTVAEELVELVDVAVVLRPAELDRGHVDPGLRPERHDFAEIPVAHVGVHLDVDWLIEDPIQSCPHPARVDRPQLRSLFRGQGPSFTHRGLVDLHDPRAGIDEVADLLRDRSGDRPEEPVIGNSRRAEAPVHDRDRAGQHPLDGLAGCGLGDLPLAHGDRFGDGR